MVAWYEDLRQWQARYFARAIEKQTEVAAEIMTSWLRLATSVRYTCPEAVARGAQALRGLLAQLDVLLQDLAGFAAPDAPPPPKEEPAQEAS